MHFIKSTKYKEICLLLSVQINIGITDKSEYLPSGGTDPGFLKLAHYVMMSNQVRTLAQ